MPQTIKVTIHKKPTLKLKVLPRFPSDVTATSPILLSRIGGNYAFSFDLTALEATLGAVYQPLDATLNALAALNSTAGLLVETAADTFTKRTLQPPAAGITISNPAGTAGDPTLVLRMTSGRWKPLRQPALHDAPERILGQLERQSAMLN